MAGFTEKSGFIRRACQACAYVAVKDQGGNIGIGSSFHLGDGYYATARHVVFNMEIEKFCPFTSAYLLDDEICEEDRIASNTKVFDGEKAHISYNIHYRKLPEILNVYFHQDAAIDIAIIQVGGIDRNTPSLILPPFLDDALGATDLLLEEVLIFGYPPILFTEEPNIVVATGQVNAVVDTVDWTAI